MTIIEQIKAEIERHLNSATEHQNANPDMPKYRWYLYEGEKELCTDLLDYIDDSLESETKKNEKVPTRIYLGSKYEFIRRDIILKEIEGLKKNNEVSDDSEYAPYELDVACGYDMACDDILSFLKPFAEVDKHPKNILAPSKECEPGLREPLESEKPMNQEGLEQEIIKCWQEWVSPSNKQSVEGVLPLSEFAFYARHFALWQKEQMMKEGLNAVKSGQSDKIEKTIAGVFVKYGMDKQKEIMMKGAVEKTVVQITRKRTPVVMLTLDANEYKDGDKVKVII